jgi:plastocyanin
MAMSGGAARADDAQRYPIPEGGVVQQLPAGSCASESQFDTQYVAKDPAYRNACRRLRIVFGPIVVQPGKNDVLIQPVTVEKPAYDGYMIRFKPSMIDATGYSPPVEQIHLHHGTWLNANNNYGSGPWLATGEEKTIAAWPKGYGLRIAHDDVWLFLHMVHSAVAQPRTVWVTYDIDFVEASYAENTLHLKKTKGIWLDVGGGKFDPKTETYPFNPVYNVQRGFGHIDPETGHRVCSFPAENCANYNSLDHVSAQQGIDVSGRPVNGMDWQVPYGFLGGTRDAPKEGSIVVMGGHLHNGGIRDEVSVVRCQTTSGLGACPFTGSIIDYSKVAPSQVVEREIHTSDAYYWNHTDSTLVGAPPVSWDFAMTGVTADIGWKVRVREGDLIRLNAVYDTEIAAWYENMGIVMAWVAPGDLSGIDLWEQNGDGSFKVGISRGIAVDAVVPGGDVPGMQYPRCVPSATTLCTRGQVTHGHYNASGHHGVCNPCPPLVTTLAGPLMTEINFGGFTFGPADFGAIALNGIPTVKLNAPVVFRNLDAGAYLWHTVTACGFPCTGPTTTDYPISDGTTSLGQLVDFDSTELGQGLGASGNLTWSYSPTKLGIQTFYCRIHPGMRGAINVVA